MPVKIFVSNADKQAVARRLLDAADDPQHVRVEKTRGFGFVISDDLAEKLGLKPGDEVQASHITGVADKAAVDEPESDKDSEDSSGTATKPKRGRPAGKTNTKKAEESSDGE
jgi:hypothetical protein